MKWRSKKAAQKLKYGIEKTYEVEVICLSIRRERQIYVCFVPCWKNWKQYKKIHFLCRTCPNLIQSPFTTIERTMKEFGVSNHLAKKRALNKEKGVLREYSRIFSPCSPRTPPFSFTPRNYSTVFIFFTEFNKFLLKLR